MDFKKSLNIKKSIPSSEERKILESNPVSKNLIIEKSLVSEDVGVSQSEPNKDIDVELVAKVIIKIIGREPLENLKSNENFSFSILSDSKNLTDWVVLALKTFFTLEDIKVLSGSILNHRYSYKESMILIKKKFIDSIVEDKKKIDLLSKDIASKKCEISKLNNSLRKSLPLKKLVNSFIDDSPLNKKLISILNELIEEPSSDSSDFCLGLISGWSVFQKSLSENIDENKKIHNINSSLSLILENISEKYISQRRDILKELANISNSYLVEYEFVSPEHTLTIDPTLHNVSGLGGTEIKEGISYSVIRSDTRKTVVYADVILTD